MLESSLEEYFSQISHQKKLSHKLSLSMESLLLWIDKGKFSGYVKGDLKGQQELNERFANFPSIFKGYQRWMRRYWIFHARVR